MTMRYTCNSCGGKGYDKPTGYMPRAAVCLECEGEGETIECPVCQRTFPASFLENREDGLCEECEAEKLEEQTHGERQC